MSLLGIINLYYHYKGARRSWDNSVDFTYGLQKRENEKLQKNDDRIDLNSKFGIRASEYWNYSTQLNFRSQLTPTQSPDGEKLVSRFMSPAFILTSIGMDYKPNAFLSVLISPFTGKFTVVQDQRLADLGTFGVRPARMDTLGQPVPGTGENFRGEVGAFLNSRLRRELMKNITLQTKLDLFSNYLNKPENVDLNCENLVSMKVNQYVSVNIFVHFIYDDDTNIPVDTNSDGIMDGQVPRLQFKETFGVGLSYKR